MWLEPGNIVASWCRVSTSDAAKNVTNVFTIYKP